MYADSFYLGVPDWSRQAERRLLVSCAMSAFCIATIVLVLQFPVAEQSRPFAELLVQILVEEVKPAIPDPVEESAIDEQAVDEPVQAESALPSGEDMAEDQRPSRDWHADISDSVSATLDNVPRQYSVNPVFDEKRRQAREKFAPSRAPREVPIWENVEKDTLGRTVLWSGDCYRILDDPNVGSREAFETFGQFMVSCLAKSDSPKLLPWVNEIQSRRASQARYGRPAAE